MHFIIEDPTLIFLLTCFLALFILTQIYLILKIKIIVERLLNIFMKMDRVIRKFRLSNNYKPQKTTQSCQNCKFRRIFYHSDSESYFYIKCFLNNQPVDPDFCCPNFVMDEQGYEI